MQKFLHTSYQKAVFYHLIIVASVLIGLSACENPGSVGGGITEPTADVVRDTIVVENLRSVVATSFSGEKNYFSAGLYEDPLFGSLNATGYFKPSLPASSDTMKADAEMLVQFMFNASEVYGDSVASQQFDLYEIGQFWRDRALMVDDELSLESSKLAELTVGTEDSLVVNLSDIAPNWVDEYRTYANEALEDTTGAADSAYVYEAHGLALVPQGEGKIIPFYQDSTQFIIQHPEADTFRVGLNRWGYHLNRGNDSSIPQGSVPLHSTYESVISFDKFDLEGLQVEAPGLSGAELVLYENESALSLSSEPISAKRAQKQVAYLHLANVDRLPESIDPGAPLSTPTRLQGVYVPEDGSYRFDVTTLLENIIRNGYPEDLEFFVTLPNDGVIKSTLIMSDSDQVPYGLKPKLIITSLKNISN